MLEATLRKSSMDKSIGSIYGDARPALSFAEAFPSTSKIEPALGNFKLGENSLPPSTNDYRRDIFNVLLERDYAKLKNKPKNPVILNRIGFTYMQAGKLPKAIKFFRQAYEQNPRFLSAAQNLAKALVLSGKIAEAERVYSSILKLVTNNDALLHEYSFIKLIGGKPVEAQGLLKRIQPSFSHYYEVQNTFGLILLTQNKKPEAKKYFEKSILINAGYAHAWNNIGVIELENGKLKSAKKYFERAIDLDQNYVVAHLNLFKLQVKENDFSTALQHISSIQHLAQIDTEVLFKKPWTLMKLGRLEEAIEGYYKFLEIVPENSSALNNLGHCYVKLGNPDKAVGLFQRAYNANKANQLPVHNLMIVLTDAGRHREAKKIADQVLAAGIKDDATFYSLGTYHIEEESWDEAEHHLEKALEMKTEIESVYANLGFLYTDIRGEHLKAINMLKARYDKGARGFDTVNNLIHAYLRGNKIKEAKKYIRLITRTNHPVGLATLGLYAIKVGNLNEAKALYDSAIKIAPDKIKNVVRQYRHLDLAIYYMEQNRKDEAVSELNKVILLKSSKKYIVDNAVKLLK